MSRRELQELAKQHGIHAGQKSTAIIAALESAIGASTPRPSPPVTAPKQGAAERPPPVTTAKQAAAEGEATAVAPKRKSKNLKIQNKKLERPTDDSVTRFAEPEEIN